MTSLQTQNDKFMEKLISIRGATQASENSIKGIKDAVAELLKKIIKQNNLDSEKIVNIMFTITDDLTAIYPATIAREELKLESIPMLCMQEMNVPNHLPRCIRVMVNVYSELRKEDIKHIYLGKANELRPDLKV